MTNSNGNLGLVSGNDPRDSRFITDTLAELSQRQKLMIADAINYVERLNSYGRDAHNLTILIYTLYSLLRDKDHSLQDLTAQYDGAVAEAAKITEAYENVNADRVTMVRDFLTIGELLHLQDFSVATLEAFYRAIQNLYHGSHVKAAKEAENKSSLRDLYMKLKNINQVLDLARSDAYEEALAAIRRLADLSTFDTAELSVTTGNGWKLEKLTNPKP